MRNPSLRVFLFAAMLLGTGSAHAADMRMAAPKACTIEESRQAAMLAAPYDAFDQTMTGNASWRPLIDEGCYAAAADVVSLYLTRNAGRLSAEQIWTMRFHVGQALAMGGEDAQSIPWFKQSRDPQADTEWLAYVDATLAFLTKDASALAAGRAAYAAAPHHGAQRLKVIDGFRACLTKTYTEALMCAPAQP